MKARIGSDREGGERRAGRQRRKTEKEKEGEDGAGECEGEGREREKERDSGRGMLRGMVVETKRGESR